jgi:hypothetical protein
MHGGETGVSSWAFSLHTGQGVMEPRYSVTGNAFLGETKSVSGPSGAPTKSFQKVVTMNTKCIYW